MPPCMLVKGGLSDSAAGVGMCACERMDIDARDQFEALEPYGVTRLIDRLQAIQTPETKSVLFRVFVAYALKYVPPNHPFPFLLFGC